MVKAVADWAEWTLLTPERKASWLSNGRQNDTGRAGKSRQTDDSHQPCKPDYGVPSSFDLLRFLLNGRHNLVGRGLAGCLDPCHEPLTTLGE